MKSTSRNIDGQSQRTNIAFYILATLFLGTICHDVSAQSSAYQIQADDRLQIAFWENPELNSQVTVDRDGGIGLPVIGRITAGGLTIGQLREKLISQMALYNKVITQVDISVEEYGANRLFVTGQVSAPGKYSFEEIPGLWDVILEAGGPLETALLDEVVIVRSEEDGEIFTVNLSDAMRFGRMSELPGIRPGDTIHVPGASESGGSASPLVKKDNIYILGAVVTPGAHKFESDLNLIQVIASAGGATPDADLRKVKHVSVSLGRTVVAEIDLEEYTHSSIPTPMPIGAGDAVVIPRRVGLSPFMSTLITATITTAITSTILILAKAR